MPVRGATAAAGGPTAVPDCEDPQAGRSISKQPHLHFPLDTQGLLQILQEVLPLMPLTLPPKLGLLRNVMF